MNAARGLLILAASPCAMTPILEAQWESTECQGSFGETWRDREPGMLRLRVERGAKGRLKVQREAGWVGGHGDAPLRVSAMPPGVAAPPFDQVDLYLDTNTYDDPRR